MSQSTMPPQPFLLNTAQETGIEGVSEQMERTHALISSVYDFLKGLQEMSAELSKDDLGRALTLLLMAETELADTSCLTRIREGCYR